MHKLIHLGIALQLLLGGMLTTVSAVTSQGSPHSVKITVEPEQVVPGASVLVTVHMFTMLDDAREVLDVSLPNEMEVLGLPTCSGACAGAGITPGTNDVTANFNVGSYDPNPQKSATLSFTAIVSVNARPGSYLPISAYLGSPAASDSAGVIVNTPPAPAPNSLYLDISPDGVVLGPGGSFLVFAHPLVQFTPGLLQEPLQTLPSVTVRAKVPAGLSLDPDSQCLYLSPPINTAPLCSISTSSHPDGSTVVSVVLPMQERSIGIFLLLTNHNLEPQDASSITFTFEESSGSIGIANPSTNMEIFAVESLASTGGDSSTGALNVLVISDAGGCAPTRPLSDYKLAIAEWGGGPILSTSTTQALASLQDLQELEDRCPRLVSFVDIAFLPLYLLGGDPGPGMGDTFCHACVLGTVPWVENGIPIITSNPYD